MMLFGEFDLFRNRGWLVTVALNDAAGLRSGSTVTLNGVPIGRVDAVQTADDIVHPVRILASITAENRLPKPVVPMIQSSLIGGGGTLRFQTSPGLTRLDEFYPQDGSALITGEAKALPEQVADMIGAQIGPLAESLKSFGRLAETYDRLGRDLDDLVKPVSDAELADGTVANLRVTVAKFNATLADAQQALAGARKWLGDDALRGDVTATVAEARGLMTDARGAVAKYGDLADSLQRDANDVVQRVGPIAEQISQTLAEMRRIAALATTGDGSVAQLLNRPDLYRSLLDSSHRLERALEETELLMKKIKQEGLKLDLK
ncbi:MAG: MlaD family protein [Phycisphaerales bacterium]